MNKIFKKIKGLENFVLGNLLSLIFTNRAKPQSMVLPNPLYGVSSPEEILSRYLSYIGGAFLVFVIAPVVGLIWYRKHGGTKKWPSVIVWTFATLFILVLVAFIISLYSGQTFF